MTKMAGDRDERPIRRPVTVLLYCLVVFVTSRLLLELIGVGALELLPLAPSPVLHGVTFSPSPWLDIWGAWDSEWFVDLAQNGYDSEVRHGPRIEGQANWAFFPLFPQLGRLLADLTGLTIFPSLLVVANIAFVAALPLIWRETAALYGARAAFVAVAVFCFAPGSYIFSSAYSESVFLLFAVACFTLARERRFLLAGLMAAAATLTRNLGVLLAIPILLYAVETHARNYRPREIVRAAMALVRKPEGWRLAFALCLPVAALAAYMLYLWQVAGDPLAFATVQKAWFRVFENPVITLVRPFLPDETLQPYHVASFVMAWVSVVLLVMLRYERNWPHVAYMAAVVLITLSSGVLSYFRFFLTMLPGMLLLAAIIARRPAAGSVILAILATANGFLMVTWAVGVNVY